MGVYILHVDGLVQDGGLLHCKSMGWYKKDVTPVRQQWSYVFLALTHQFAMELP